MNQLNSLSEINRVKLRFTGIGERVPEEPGKFWPRDKINPNHDSDVILSTLVINDPETLSNIKSVIVTLLSRLRECKTNQLFQKYCPLDHKFFDEITFDIHHALEAHSSYSKVLSFVHGVLRSLERKNDRFLLKLFGDHRNFSIYRGHIKWLVIGNFKLRLMNVEDFIRDDRVPVKSMNLDKISWLSGLDSAKRFDVFLRVIFDLTRHIAELLRRYFYITTGNPFANQIFYFRYDLWQKIQDREIKRLVAKDLLHYAPIGDSVDTPATETSKMKFHLKKNGLRLICTSQKPVVSKIGTRDEINFKRAVLKYLMRKLPNFTKFQTNTLLTELRKFKREKFIEGKQVYFVRADMLNCFPSIRQPKLRDIILNLLATNLSGSNTPDENCHRPNVSRSGRDISTGYRDPIEDRFQEVNIKFYKIGFCQTHRNRNSSLVKNKEQHVWTMEPEWFFNHPKYEVIGIFAETKISLDKFDAHYLRPKLINPVLKISRSAKNYYNLVKGIRQGSKFSTALNAIYIQSAMNEHLGDLMNSDDCKIFTYVDDILFISTNYEKSKVFMQKMLTGFKDYDLRINSEKLACNFNYRTDEDQPESDLCRLGDYVTFFRRKINLETFQCSNLYDYGGLELCHTFSVTPYDTIRAIQQTVAAAQIEPMILDVQLNGIKQVVINIFEYAALIAHRIGTLMIVSFEYRSLDKQSPELLVSQIKSMTKRLFALIGSLVRKERMENDFDYHTLRYIITAAFYATWCRNKLRHRIRERNYLRKRDKKFGWQYLIDCHRNVQDKESDPNNSLLFARKDYINTVVRSSVRQFDKSNFSKEIILPSRM